MKRPTFVLFALAASWPAYFDSGHMHWRRRRSWPWRPVVAGTALAVVSVAGVIGLAVFGDYADVADYIENSQQPAYLRFTRGLLSEAEPRTYAQPVAYPPGR